jgi:hypothetical protein
VKVVSSKPGSNRERVDVEADMLPVAAWRAPWAPSQPGRVRAGARCIVLSSRFGAERSTELWLTELEAIAIAQMVMSDAMASAVERLTKAPAAVSGGQEGA